MLLSLAEQLAEIRKTFVENLAKVKSKSDLETTRITFLGRKSNLQSLIKQLSTWPNDSRSQAGALINALKEELNASYEEKAKKLKSEKTDQPITDPTLPGRRWPIGRRHPIRQMSTRIVKILSRMGFAIRQGPDAETDWYNYEGLNFPQHHPARNLHDTIYLETGKLLRSHTSTIQLRVMEREMPPLRIVSPGRVYRHEEINARSYVAFSQVDFFAIDRDITLADLLETTHLFYRQLLGDRKLRFRPSYFPFVEPGLEVDIACLCRKGCPLCKGTCWLEVAGAGMIHPNVLEHGRVDSKIYSGFALGMGVDRLAMLEHGIRDIRLFWQSDLRFLEQFPTW